MFWNLFTRRRPSRKPYRRPTTRLQVEALEDRLALANYTWVGPAGGNWSVAANWNPATGVPGNNDTVTFTNAAGGGANTNSTMDLGGGVQYNIAKIFISPFYNSTITLNSNLVTNVLDMNNGTITPAGKKLTVTQVNPVLAETSYWRGGRLEVHLETKGEAAHRLTLVLGGLGPPDLQGDWFNKPFSTVEWNAGNVNIGAGRAFDNEGTFIGDSPGRMGNNLGVGNEWFAFNRATGTMVYKKGIYPNNKLDNKGWQNKVASIDGAGTTEIIGTLVQYDTGTTSVGAGLLLVTGTYTQEGGATSLDGANTTFEVTEAYTMNGGTASATWYQSRILVDGGFQQNGGATTLGGNGGSLSAGTTVVLSGGTMKFETGPPVTVLTAGSGVQIQAGGTLVSMRGTISGNVTNAGSINLGDGTLVGTLNITGNYTQASTGTLREWLGGSGPGQYSQLHVSGFATFAGSLIVGSVNGFVASAIDSWTMITYVGHTGVFDSISYPPIWYPGYWEPEYGASAFVLKALL